MDFVVAYYGNQAGAAAAISELVRNDTYITFGWTGANTVTVGVGDYEVNITFWLLGLPTPGDTLAAQLTWLRGNAQSGNRYVVKITADEYISPALTALPTGRTDLTVTLVANARSEIRLSANGALFEVVYGVTLVLGENVTLVGRSAGGNNTTALVWVNSGGTLEMNAGVRIMGNTGWGGGVHVSGGTFTMRSGEISGNTAWSGSGSGGVHVGGGTFAMHGGEISGNTTTDRNSGGGVGVRDGTFAMHGGEISGNSATGSQSGGGVSVRGGGTFTMRGGEISGNSATGNNCGGGVHVGSWGTFQIENGVIHGSDAEEGLRNTGPGGAALSVSDGTAQYGTFDPVTSEFRPSGTLFTTDLTIEVRNGLLINLARRAAFTITFAQTRDMAPTIPLPREVLR